MSDVITEKLFVDYVGNVEYRSGVWRFGVIISIALWLLWRLRLRAN